MDIDPQELAEAFERAQGDLGKFDANKHPRDSDGRFTTGGSMAQGAWGQGSGKPPRGLPGGPSHKLKSPLASRYRAHLDPEYADVSPESTRFGMKTFDMKPQKPAKMSDEDFVALGRKASATTRALREPINLAATEQGLIPEGADPKHVRLAFNHARNLALHDVGLVNYQFGFDDATKEHMKPLTGYIRYARRRMTQDPMGLRPQYKGQWKQFKDEYGYEFADKRKDPRTGETRRRFYPHAELVRADTGDLGKRELSVAELEQRRDAARASAAARKDKKSFGYYSDKAKAWNYDARLKQKQRWDENDTPIDAVAYRSKALKNMGIGAAAGAAAGGAVIGGIGLIARRKGAPINGLGQIAASVTPITAGIGANIGAYLAVDKTRRKQVMDSKIEPEGGGTKLRRDIAMAVIPAAIAGTALTAANMRSTAKLIRASGHDGNAMAHAVKMGAGTLLPTIGGATIFSQYAGQGMLLPQQEADALDTVVPGKKTVMAVAGGLAGAALAPAIYRTATVGMRRKAYRAALRAMKEKGETLVFRGAPVNDTAPITRGFGAVYVARHKPVTYTYAGPQGNVARYALKPNLKFVDLTQKHGTEEDLKLAQRLIFRDKAEKLKELGHGATVKQTAFGPITLPGTGKAKLSDYRAAWKDSRSRQLQPEYQGGQTNIRADEGDPDLRELHWRPTKEQIEYMRRRGIAGTTSGRRNLAMNEGNYVRFIAGVPRSTANTPDRVARRLAVKTARTVKAGVNKVKSLVGKADQGDLRKYNIIRPKIGANFVASSIQEARHGIEGVMDRGAGGFNWRRGPGQKLFRYEFGNENHGIAHAYKRRRTKDGLSHDETVGMLLRSPSVITHGKPVGSNTSKTAVQHSSEVSVYRHDHPGHDLFVTAFPRNSIHKSDTSGQLTTRQRTHLNGIDNSTPAEVRPLHKGFASALGSRLAGFGSRFGGAVGDYARSAYGATGMAARRTGARFGVGVGNGIPNIPKRPVGSAGLMRPGNTVQQEYKSKLMAGRKMRMVAGERARGQANAINERYRTMANGKTNPFYQRVAPGDNASIYGRSKVMGLQAQNARKSLNRSLALRSKFGRAAMTGVAAAGAYGSYKAYQATQ